MFQKLFHILIVSVTVVLNACSDQSNTAAQQTNPIIAENIKIGQWGPTATVAGQGFGVRSNGNSSLWFQQKGIESSSGVEVWLGTNKVDGPVIQPNILGTVEIRPELISKPGKFPLFIVVTESGKKIPIGEFEITKK